MDTVVNVTKYLGHGSWYNDDDIDDRLGDDPMSKQYYDRTLNENSDIKDMKLSQVMKLVKDGDWETDTDIVPHKHVILKNKNSGKQKVVNVRPDKVTEGNFNIIKKSKLKEMIKSSLNEENNIQSRESKAISMAINGYDYNDICDWLEKQDIEYDERERIINKVEDYFNKLNEQEDEEVEDNWNKTETDDTPSDSDLDKQALKNAKASKGKGKKLDFIIKELESLKKEMISMVKNWKQETDPVKKQQLMTTLKKKQEIRNELEAQKEKLASKMI